MKTITVGFSKPRTFKIGAWLISKWMGKEYSHAYMRYIDSAGRDMIFQSSHGLVHLVTAERFFKDNKLVIEYPIEATDNQYEEFRNFIYSKLGLPYDYANIMYIPIHDVLWKCSIYWKSPDASGFICSELAAECLTNVYLFDYWFNKPFNLVKPDDLEQVLIERPN